MAQNAGHQSSFLQHSSFSASSWLSPFIPSASISPRIECGFDVTISEIEVENPLPFPSSATGNVQMIEVVYHFWFGTLSYSSPSLRRQRFGLEISDDSG